MPGMIHLLPIEPLELRYSAQWLRWFVRELEHCPRRFRVWSGEPVGDIRSGQFLDVFGTHIFKLTQLAGFIKAIECGGVSDGDVVFVMDLWFPGLEALAYIRQGAGIDFKIVGILHAGTYDPYDFLTQKGMGVWGQDLENSWLGFVDQVYVATEFHKTLILQHRIAVGRKIVVTGLPFYPAECMAPPDFRRFNVVFPHRLAPEKAPLKFSELLGRSGLSGIRTMDYCRNGSKADLYGWLAASEVAISYAKQETFGIVMLEACANGCLPLVPNRLSYSEMYPPEFRYEPEAEEYLEDRIRDMIANRKHLEPMARAIPQKYVGSIGRMLEAISCLT